MALLKVWILNKYLETWYSTASKTHWPSSSFLWCKLLAYSYWKSILFLNFLKVIWLYSGIYIEHFFFNIDQYRNYYSSFIFCDEHFCGGIMPLSDVCVPIPIFHGLKNVRPCLLDNFKSKPLKIHLGGSSGHVALWVYKSKLFLAQKCKKIFLFVKGVQKTEKNWKNFWKKFEIFFS